jgi:hypothetical protein
MEICKVRVSEPKGEQAGRNTNRRNGVLVRRFHGGGGGGGIGRALEVERAELVHGRHGLPDTYNNNKQKNQKNTEMNNTKTPQRKQPWWPWRQPRRASP